MTALAVVSTFQKNSGGNLALTRKVSALLTSVVIPFIQNVKIMNSVQFSSVQSLSCV